MKDGLSIDNYGNKTYYLNNKLHRDDGPVYESKDRKSWWVNEIRHRTDGPAIEFADGRKRWFLYGEEINCSSQEEFERLIKLKAFW